MKVFISYAREDEALAHLLAYVLEKTGHFECRFDRDLPKGLAFDANLRKMINEVDLVLVLLTKRAITSQWVNQEIGFATALDKIVYPLAVERDVQPEGMIRMCQKCSLFDWSDPKHTIERLIEDLRCGGNSPSSPGKSTPLDLALDSTHARVNFLIDRLKALVQDGRRPLIVRQQAAFSIFASGTDSLYPEIGKHSPDYMKLLLEERDLTDKLVRPARTQFRLILWPVRNYPESYKALRFKNVLEWLREVEAQPNIEFRCAEYPGPGNRLIVSEHFVLDGYKARVAAGFDFSMASFQPDRIEKAEQEFDAVWRKLNHTKADAIARIEAMYQELGVA